MKKQALKIAAALLAAAGFAPQAQAQTVAELLTEENGYTKVTEMPAEADLAKYYYVITVKDHDLMVTLEEGSGRQQAGHKTWWYRTATDPAGDLNKVWMIEANNGVNSHETGYAFRNVKEPELLMQTEWNAAYYFRTHDQKNPCEWTQILFKYDTDGDYWTFENGKYPISSEATYKGFVGPWEPNEGIKDGTEVAGNKTEAEASHFVIYSIERETFLNEKYQEGNPLDMNFLVAEVGNSKNGWIDSFSAEYTHPGNYQYNNAENKNNTDLGLSKKGYIEAWNAGTDFTGTLTYTKNDLPNGHYKISAYAFTSLNGETSFTANGKEVTLEASTDLYTNPTIDNVTVGDGTLTFGLKITKANWIGITNIQLQYLSKLTDEEELSEAKKALESYLKTAEAITNVNVGDGAFQIPTAAYTKLSNSIAAAKKVSETDAAALRKGKTDLMAAVDEYNGTALNPPAEGKHYNIVHTEAGNTFDNKAITYLDNRSGEGDYNIQYLKEVDANYAQAFTFTAADEADTYYLSMTDKDGNERYMCRARAYGEDKNIDGIRTTTEKDKALAIKVSLTDKEGVYNLYNTAAAKYIGNNGDAGVYSINQHNDFKLLEAKEAEVTLTMPDYGWATLILPFDAEIPEGLTVHTWNGTVKEDGSELDLQDESAIKANTPYIVSGTGKYEFKGYGLACKAEYSNEHMGGFIALQEVTLIEENKKISVTEVKVAKGDYVLQKHDDEYGFYKVGETQPKVVAYKAYLKYTAPSGVNANLLNLPGTRGADNVDSALTDSTATVDVYSVSGILVRSNVKADEALVGLPKGIYIVGGVKKAVK